MIDPATRYSREQAAELLLISPRQLDTIRKANRIAYTQVAPRTWIFLGADLLDYLESNRVPAKLSKRQQQCAQLRAIG